VPGLSLWKFTKGPATQNAVCRSRLRSLSAAECYTLSRLNPPVHGRIQSPLTCIIV